MGTSRSSLGTAYLMALLADASLDVIATLAPPMEALSDPLTTLVTLASVVVVILSVMGKLEPRALFLWVSIAYLAIEGAAALFIVFALFAKLGPARVQAMASEGITIAALARELPWYLAVHWPLVGLIALVAVWGNVAYWTATTEGR